MSAPRPTFPSTFQFERTRPIRLAVYREARLSLRRRILDVGCGEALVAEEMAMRTGRPVYAVDRAAAQGAREGVRRVVGDAMRLPFADASFDAVSFHFVLLWVRNPATALAEARRVLRPGGVVMALSEPDLTARTDEPDTGLGRAIVRSVERGGGHPDVGRNLGAWLEGAGFHPSVHITTAEWAALTNPAEAEHELAFLESAAGLSPQKVRAMANAEREAALAGTRRVHLPLAYGVGHKD